MSPSIRQLVHALFAVTALSLSTAPAADPAADVAKLLAQLKDPNEAVRLKAAKELGKLKEHAKSAVDALGKVAASDPDEDVRSIAKKSLAVIRESVAEADKEKDKEALAPLLKTLKSKKAAERVSALDELTKLGEKARPATSAIVEATMDSAPTVREAAAGCLEKVDSTLHKHVIAILYDKNKVQLADALAQLQKLGPRAKPAVPVLKSFYTANTSRLKHPDMQALTTLVAIVPDDALIVNEVLQIVSGSATTVNARASGLQLLDSLETTKKKKVDALIAALGDARLRVSVIEKLAKFGPDAKAALPSLMKLKLDNVAAVRDAATKAIETVTAE